MHSTALAEQDIPGSQSSKPEAASFVAVDRGAESTPTTHGFTGAVVSREKRYPLPFVVLRRRSADAAPSLRLLTAHGFLDIEPRLVRSTRTICSPPLVSRFHHANYPINQLIKQISTSHHLSNLVFLPNSNSRNMREPALLVFFDIFLFLFPISFRFPHLSSSFCVFLDFLAQLRLLFDSELSLDLSLFACFFPIFFVFCFVFIPCRFSLLFIVFSFVSIITLVFDCFPFLVQDSSLVLLADFRCIS